ncbi:MAG: hypothetical protein RL095_3977 [Verrucomicrobiota bacterium]
MKALRHPGILAALAAAALFGFGTPLAKLLLGDSSPWLMAALLYLGAGIGLLGWRRLSSQARLVLPRRELGWFAGAVLFGGIAGPLLLMWGLQRLPASSASLLLNAEGVLTALLAWFVFKENFDRRIAIGMAAIVAGALILSWPDKLEAASLLPALAVTGACLCWAVDNNLTRKVSLSDGTWIAMVKGLVAGSVNLVIAIGLGCDFPSPPRLGACLLLGFFSYGLSLALFIVALRHLGAARSGAYFSLAPFLGAALALALGETASAQLLLAALLMGFGLWLHLSEIHDHEHQHEELEHEHQHDHNDGHHDHSHPFPWDKSMPHSHPHLHQALRHSHPHYPDAHHQHRH